MTQVISGQGSKIQVLTTITFPAGFTITQFADDVDAYDVPSVDISDNASGANGDLIVWSKAIGLSVVLGVIAKSDSDQLLAILFEANRAAAGKTSANDVVTMVHQYPDGHQTTYINGIIKSGPPSRSMASTSRYKSHAYGFVFENKVSS